MQVSTNCVELKNNLTHKKTFHYLNYNHIVIFACLRVPLPILAHFRLQSQHKSLALVELLIAIIKIIIIMRRLFYIAPFSHSRSLYRFMRAHTEQYKKQEVKQK